MQKSGELWPQQHVDGLSGHVDGLIGLIHGFYFLLFFTCFTKVGSKTLWKRPRLNMTFDPRWLACPPQLMSFARLH
jgi:hypothetical protein